MTQQEDKLIIREIKKDEYKILDDFIYEAIFIPEGVEKPPKDIIYNEDLQVYIKDFGKSKDDNCLVAEYSGRIVGACWTRIMNDYGHVDDETPSFAISLYEEYRGRGIGTELMRQMLSLLKSRGYKKASLAVQKANYAVKMYKNVGFKIVNQNDEEYIMICDL
jgi:ribosomal protein S18 acetylase RimI-like enzyme